jgi:hypothetical protein
LRASVQFPTEKRKEEEEEKEKKEREERKNECTFPPRSGLLCGALT